MPLVSVITPCYRQGHFLDDAIASVLAQSCADLELIVVDDGSPDETRRVALEHAAGDRRVRLVVQTNRGLANARNAGLARATGRYVVFLDADDRLLPDAIGAGIASLEQNGCAAYTRGKFDIIDAQGRLMDESREDTPASEDEYELLLRESPIWVPAAVMFRRAVFDVNAAFDSRVSAAADLELYLRLARLYPVASHATTVAQYRRHANNMSMNPTIMAPAVLRVLEAQREYVSSNGRWREAHQFAVREWEHRHLIPMMRKAITDLMRGDPVAMNDGYKLMVTHGPGAVTRRLLRRMWPASVASTKRELGTADGVA